MAGYLEAKGARLVRERRTSCGPLGRQPATANFGLIAVGVQGTPWRAPRVAPPGPAWKELRWVEGESIEVERRGGDLGPGPETSSTAGSPVWDLGPPWALRAERSRYGA